MKELPDDRTMDELLELAKDAYQKARLMYDTATDIADKWESRDRAKQAAKQKVAKNE